VSEEATILILITGCKKIQTRFPVDLVIEESTSYLKNCNLIEITLTFCTLFTTFKSIVYY